MLGLQRDSVTWPFTCLMSKESGTRLWTIAALHMQVPFSKAVRSRSRCSSEKKLHMLLLSAWVQRGKMKMRPNGGNTQCHLAPGLEARRFTMCHIETMIQWLCILHPQTSEHEAICSVKFKKGKQYSKSFLPFLLNPASHPACSCGRAEKESIALASQEIRHDSLSSIFLHVPLIFFIRKGRKNPLKMVQNTFQ